MVIIKNVRRREVTRGKTMEEYRDACDKMPVKEYFPKLNILVVNKIEIWLKLQSQSINTTINQQIVRLSNAKPY